MNNWIDTPASTIYSLSAEEPFHGSADMGSIQQLQEDRFIAKKFHVILTLAQ